MVIKTKYNKGDVVVVLHGSKLYLGVIEAINFSNNHIKYLVLLEKATTSLDKDKIKLFYEEECFSSWEELKKYWESQGITFKKQHDTK